MSAVPVHARVGALWQQRMQALREYEIVRDGNAFGAGFSNSFVFSSEYEQARRHLETLLSRYRGMPIDEQFHGKEIVNDGGTCFALEYRQDLSNPAFDLDRFRTDLMEDLTLVHGIGPGDPEKVECPGIPIDTGSAGASRDEIRVRIRSLHVYPKGILSAIMDLIGSRHSKSHASVLGTAGLHEPEDYVFIDIETLGLFSRPIILFGDRGDRERGAYRPPVPAARYSRGAGRPYRDG